MSKLERITVTMPAEMAARLRAAVERGEYATTSEVVREALRDWGEERDKGEARRQWLRSEIEKGAGGAFLPRRSGLRRIARSGARAGGGLFGQG